MTLTPQDQPGLQIVATGAGFAPNQSRYTQAVGDEIVRRLEAGETLAAISRDPAMPAPVTVHKWAALNPGFGAAKAMAQQTALKSRRAAAARKLRKSLTRLAEEGRAPGARPVGYSEELAETICRRIAHGEPLIDICRDPDMPSHVTVNAWMRRDRSFEYMVGLAREHQAQVNADLIIKIAAAATPATVGVARLQIQALRWQAAKLAPQRFSDKAGLPPRHVIEKIRADRGKGYWAQKNPDLVPKALGTGDWD